MPSEVKRMRKRALPLGEKNIAGHRIEQIRMEKGLKQKYIIERMHIRGIPISISTFSKIEGQVRLLCDYELAAIAEILEVPVSALLTD